VPGIGSVPQNATSSSMQAARAKATSTAADFSQSAAAAGLKAMQQTSAYLQYELGVARQACREVCWQQLLAAHAPPPKQVLQASSLT
jgi:hypothetical protein